MADLKPFEIPLNGKLYTSDDPLMIGPNFSTLDNLRYRPTHLKAIKGMTKINSSALTKPLIRTGFHYRKIAPAESHILVQAFSGNSSGAGTGAGVVYENTTAIPTTGEFSATSLWTDSTNGAQGIFSTAPGGQVAYCNGYETCVWGGNEMRTAGFIVYESTSGTYSYDFTTEINNSRNAAETRARLIATAPISDIYIGSTRPLKGFKLTMGTANTSVSTMAVSYWNGTAWTAVANLSDGTTLVNKTLGQTGSVTFDSTVSTAKIREFEGRILYWYKIVPSALSAGVTIYYCTVNAPFQKIVDLPDGTDRLEMACAKYDGTNYNDVTINVAEDLYSSNDTSTYADISSLATGTSYIVVGFTERMMGFRLHVPSDYTNGTASVMTVSYWNGTAWTAVGGLQDGTSEGGVSLAKSGLVAWTPPTTDLEFQREIISARGSGGFITLPVLLAMLILSIALIYGLISNKISLAWADLLNYIMIFSPIVIGVETGNAWSIEYASYGGSASDAGGNVYPGNNGNGGDSGTPAATPVDDSVPAEQSGGVDFNKLFYYKISWSATLDATTRLYYIGGVSAPRFMMGYSFSMEAHDRLWLLDQIEGARNKAVCSNANAPDVYNGPDTLEFFFGDSTKLTGGTRMYVSLGSTVIQMALFFKERETWAILGNGPDDWIQFRISNDIGCIAPKTIQTVNLPTSAQQGQNRQVVIWQGANGMYMFDGRTIFPIHLDIDSIFTATVTGAIGTGNSGTIGRDKASASVGFIDWQRMEYHWLFNDGTGSIEYINVEYVYDLVLHRWFQIKRGAGNELFCGFSLMDTAGGLHTYGATHNGYLMRLERDRTFDGTAMTFTFQTGGMSPEKGSSLYQTRIRGVKLMQLALKNTTNVSTVSIISDGSTGVSTDATFTPINSGFRVSDVYKPVAAKTGIFHSFKGTMTTSNEYVGFEPLHLSAWYEVMRPDMT